GRPEVRDQHREHRESRPAHAESLADEPGETLAGRERETRAHLLRDRERECRHDKDPHEAEAELRAGDRIGRDPAGIVVRERGDESGSEREQIEADAPQRARVRLDLFFQPRGSMISTTSSIVTVPMSLPRASTTGSASRSYFAMSAATSSFDVVASILSTCGSMTSASFASGFATTRSRRLMTPSRRPCESTTYK